MYYSFGAAKYIFIFNPHNGPMGSYYYYNNPSFTEEETKSCKSSEMCPSHMANEYRRQDSNKAIFRIYDLNWYTTLPFG